MSRPDFPLLPAANRRDFLTKSGAVLAAGLLPSGAAEPGTETPAAPAETKPVIVRTKELQEREPDKHLWTLHQTKTSRTNLVEMSGEGVKHIHPDADHSLYVISGEVTAMVGDETCTLHAGDYISIPAGVLHGYRVAPEKTALLISMDSPPYDPAKVIRPGAEKK